MKTPSLQELQRLDEQLDLTNLQWLALKVAAGLAVAFIPRRSPVWSQLQGMGLIDASHQLTLLGKMRLSDYLSQKIKDKEKK